MQIKKRLILSFVLLSVLNNAYAEQIEIEADSAQYLHKEGKMVHKGNVVVHWQDRILQADHLTIYKDNGENISRIEAVGHPATFQGTLSNVQNPVSGQAQRITFLMAEDVVHLEENALLSYNDDTFQGPDIRFNLKNNSVFASKDSSSRPKLIFGSKLVSSIRD